MLKIHQHYKIPHIDLLRSNTITYTYIILYYCAKPNTKRESFACYAYHTYIQNEGALLHVNMIITNEVGVSTIEFFYLFLTLRAALRENNLQIMQVLNCNREEKKRVELKRLYSRKSTFKRKKKFQQKKKKKKKASNNSGKGAEESGHSWREKIYAPWYEKPTEYSFSTFISINPFGKHNRMLLCVVLSTLCTL